MKYNDLLNSIQNIENGLIPDLNFLTTFRCISKESLEGLSLSKELIEFLTQIGLPSTVLLIREPEENQTLPRFARQLIDEEQDIFTHHFPLDKFYLKKIENNTYLSIGGWKTDDASGEYLIHTITKEVWYVNNNNLKLNEDSWNFTDIDLELQFVNSSIEQFVLSIACWKQFYPQFEKIYLQVDDDLEYIFEHDEIYEPFLNVMKILDKKAIEDELSYWRFMCDLSLY